MFNAYLNYHRPSGFATVEVADNGKRRWYRLEEYRTPHEKLVSLDEWQQYLKEGFSADHLHKQARRLSNRGESLLRFPLPLAPLPREHV